MSDLKFSCPHCQQHLECDAQLFGRQMKCPNCGRVVRIPHLPSRPLTNHSQVEEYVERELGKATPPGWKWVRPEPGRLWWCIEKTAIQEGEWGMQDFSLQVSDDLRWFIVTYGNNDMGCGSLDQALQKARVISTSSLGQYSLGSCIQFIVEHCKPNEWGYT